MKKSILLCALALGFLCAIPSTYADFPTITNYWHGTAKLNFVRSFTAAEMQNRKITNLGPGFTGGARIRVVGNTWYLFTRRVEAKTPIPEYCPQHKQQKPSHLLSIVVSKSTDEGLTWSNPVRIITPSANTAWECGATDGDAFYNPAEHQWHFLFQCLSRKGWQGCYARKSGDDPIGIFEMPLPNPVIPAGSLWAKICNVPSDKCFQIAGGLNKVKDEGTFDIFDYRNGYYFVDFHGFDGIHGFRGLAKTRDFQSWDVVAPDSILDRKDALSFRTTWEQGGPVGFGAGRIIKDQEYYYLISEAVDKSLLCKPGQHWVWGMFRTKVLTSTSWEHFADNPFFSAVDFPDQNPEPGLCYHPSYAGFFTSQTGKVYFQVSRQSSNSTYDGIYLYELVPN